MITLMHKQIIAVAGYYACGAFIGFIMSPLERDGDILYLPQLSVTNRVRPIT